MSHKPQKLEVTTPMIKAAAKKPPSQMAMPIQPLRSDCSSVERVCWTTDR
ncbi:MAG TPA: hypothetical protein VHD56_04245 [Tepidisphaeraceae bacterium]|nr:hypothetical protein [Tepidisphaeraceae bacterium]